MHKQKQMIFAAGLIIFADIFASGEICRGYCRKKEDCFGATDFGSCSDDFVCCKNTTVAEERCREYGKYVYQESQGVALAARSMARRVSECGMEAVPLVVGGVEAKPKEFPHMVAIGYGNDLSAAKWLCGGSLVSENFVLSAAHCSKSRNSGPARFVRIGNSDLTLNDSNVQYFTILKRINHPKYKAPSRYHDIALFKLSDVVQVDGHSRPACLHATSDEFTYKKAIATGWGKTDYVADEGSKDLMKVTLDLIDRSACNESFSADVGGRSLKMGVISSQLCAGHLMGGKDTCQGDSGGPLQIVRSDPYCMYSIIGITSFGKFCGFKNSPAVYTRVSYYVPWIESIVWP